MKEQTQLAQIKNWLSPISFLLDLLEESEDVSIRTKSSDLDKLAADALKLGRENIQKIRELKEEK